MKLGEESLDKCKIIPASQEPGYMVYVSYRETHGGVQEFPVIAWAIYEEGEHRSILAAMPIVMSNGSGLPTSLCSMVDMASDRIIIEIVERGRPLIGGNYD